MDDIIEIFGPDDDSELPDDGHNDMIIPEFGDDALIWSSDDVVESVYGPPEGWMMFDPNNVFSEMPVMPYESEPDGFEKTEDQIDTDKEKDTE